MLGCLLDKRQQDQTQKLIRNTRFHDILDAFNEKKGQEGNDGQGQDECDNAFGEGELGLGKVLMPIEILMLIGFQHLVEDGMLRMSVVPNETENRLVLNGRHIARLHSHKEGNDEQDRGNLANPQNVVL
jgi:hypothetical protein